MRAPEFGTDYERYLGSGIVQLSQLKRYPHPDPFYHLSSQCRKEQKQLNERFKHEICKPWLPENRLKAEISEVEWEKRMETGHKKLDGTIYPCFQFDSDTRISITEGISLLEIAWSSVAWGIQRTFDWQVPQQRWWVLDFLCDGESSLPVRAA